MSQPREKSADPTSSTVLARKAEARPGRNDPCVCGSGRKYKKCCGRRGDSLPAPEQPEPAKLPEQSAPPPTEYDFLESLITSGLYAELEEHVTRLLSVDPGNGFLWKVRALSLWKQGKDALEALQRAAHLLPDDAEAHSNLGNAFRASGKPDDAVRCHCRALDIRPDYAEAHNNLGTALQDLGRTEEALASYRRATVLKSDFALAYANLGNTLRSLGRTAEAVSHYRQAVAGRPNDAELLSRLASALGDLGEFDEATTHYGRALQLAPGSAQLHSSLGMMLALLGNTDEAEKSARRALGIDPELSAAMVLLAELHAARGRSAEAQELLRRAVAIDPDSPEAWGCLIKYRDAVGGDEAWLAQARRVAARPLPGPREARLRYALGDYFDDVQDFPQAFSNYRRANELTKQCGPGYDRQQFSRYVDLITQLYDEEWLSDACLDPAGSERTVFIVGMWRSGATLAEQILASHPGVFASGELAYWNTAAEQYLQTLISYARAASGGSGDLDSRAGGDHGLGRLAAGYLEQLRRLSPEAPRVADRMSSNFLHLGLIHACLPHARVIHMRRNPIDTCLSIYFQSFHHTHRYANDLEDLVHHCREYQRVMAHWQRVLPQTAILQVSYEQLVEEPEASIRRMLEFVGLAWDPRCLDFHQTERTVTTASEWQVRRKLSGSSLGRWRNYREFIAPLLQLAP